MMQKMPVQTRVRRIIEASIAVKRLLHDNDAILEKITQVAEVLLEVLKLGNKPILFGNGGSAADAQHIAAELVGRFAFDRDPLPALAVSVNTSCLTAVGNDYGFELVFARQIQALGRPGDLAIGISTTGNSPNVVRGIEVARAMGLRTAALTGGSGGRLKNLVDHCICVPSDETPRIQECHILVGHILSEIVEEAMFHGKSRVSGS
jgi:D-sedoheptulose 7-phosphate isomerase